MIYKLLQKTGILDKALVQLRDNWDRKYLSNQSEFRANAEIVERITIGLYDIDSAKEKLAEYGTIILSDCDFDKVTIDIERLKHWLSSIDDSYSGGKLTSYEEKANFSPFYVDVRGGKDKGMIDVFNIQNTPEFSQELDDFIKEIVYSLFDENSWKYRVNAYINNNITETRCFHRDSYKDDYKIFIYLTDVAIENGPYTYVLGSHRSVYHKLNTIFRFSRKTATDSPIVKKTMVHSFVGDEYTVVVSNQKGIHRGLPQFGEGNRILLAIRVERE